MKKAIVLGVGNAQVDLIRYLKAQGWWVIGCSYRREGRGLEYIDQFALFNITDADGIEQLARAERVDLIYSVGSDLAMPTAARVASRLGLPSLVSAETAEMLQNKLLLRGFLTEHSISPIRYKGVRSQSDLDDWTLFPAILKPVDNQGQRGVFLAASLEEARGGLENSLQFSRSRTLIIEEFLEGPEVSVNTFVINSETVFNEVSDRLVVEGYAGGIPRGHIYPSVYSAQDVRSEVQRLTVLCNRALGIQNGPVYYQAILTRNGPRIVEVTPRLDGCHMWRLIKLVSGVDLLEASVKCLLGESPPSLQVAKDLQSRYLRFCHLPPGREFFQAEHPPAAAAEYVEYYYADGETVRPINGHLEKVGYFIEPYVQ
ncbi:MAG: ATP-grasp domain-containing protein [Chloroflexota bacterium]|nr:ATP-grasp domain-containing protein [Chloroflexota bacterium]MBI5702047.1 ATP-grasp domain-containing protein [Chloroflexota bacterium]